MKISVAWIFDHIDADWRSVDIVALVDKFNTTTAEIESFYKENLNLDALSLAEIKTIQSDGIVVFSAEWGKEITLRQRDDVQPGHYCLIKKDGNSYSWVMLVDFHCNKDGLLVPLYVQKDLRAGGWKKHFENDDYILEIDNKSITHRPDMWSHRGFAREIAAILDLPFLPLDQFVTQKKITSYAKKAPASDDNPITITLKDQQAGKRFAGLYCSSIHNRESSLWMAHRLMRIGNRSINVLVDSTNYVMLDIGQPMHAFDADQLPSKTIEGRLARKGEKLTLLDNKKITLTTNDYVITDGKTPISLAGIMGGKGSGLSMKTTALFLESAHFDAGVIRRTAARFKIRTEASARFEKTLDPNQNIDAITRFLTLLDDENIDYKASDNIVSIGKEAESLAIFVEHDFIVKRLGTVLDPSFVTTTLQKLEFTVVQSGTGDDISYAIMVPTFRCSKDVTIKEDIVEEVGRYFGYENIQQKLPVRQVKPVDLSFIMRVRQIKRLLAHSLRMREVYNYSFYDESFLRRMPFEISDNIKVKNPVSENWQQLVTSLIPHLVKNVYQNSADNDSLRFFEWARVWSLKKGTIIEHKSLAGILFEHKKTIDFYDAKALLCRLFAMLHLDVQWQKVDSDNLLPWFSQNQTAHLVSNGVTIGLAGIMNSTMLSKVTPGKAFVFELSGDVLLAHKPPIKKYQHISKFPGVHRDVSMLVPHAVTADQVVSAIASADRRIHSIFLIDFFQKDEWKESKSLTIRFTIQDQEKTLTGEQADFVYTDIVKKLKKVGATIR